METLAGYQDDNKEDPRRLRIAEKCRLGRETEFELEIRLDAEVLGHMEMDFHG